MSKAHIQPGKSLSTASLPKQPVGGLPIRSLRRRPYLGLLAGLGACLILGVAVAFGARGWGFCSSSSPQAAARTEAELTCERFMRLKNAGDPEALLLLGREPHPVCEPLAQPELDRVQTDFFLRDALRIRAVVRADEQPRDPQAGVRYILVTEGRVAAPDLLLRTRCGVERSGRTMLNPDLIVEVHQGKLFGHHAELHMGP